MSGRRLHIAYPEAGWYRIDLLWLYNEEGGLEDADGPYFALDELESAHERVAANIIVWLNERYEVEQLQPYPSGMTSKHLRDYGCVVETLVPYMWKSSWTGPRSYQSYSLPSSWSRLQALIEIAALVDGVIAPDGTWRPFGFATVSDKMPVISAALRARVEPIIQEFLAANSQAAEVRMRQEAAKGDYVYVLQHGDDPLYKIGIAKDPAQRARDLSTGAPRDLRIVTKRRLARAKSAESLLHKRFAKHRVRGEWFELPDAVANELIEAVNLLQERPKGRSHEIG